MVTWINFIDTEVILMFYAIKVDSVMKFKFIFIYAEYENRLRCVTWVNLLTDQFTIYHSYRWFRPS